MEDKYTELANAFMDYIDKANFQMAFLTLLAMQELRLYINYAKDVWTTEELQTILAKLTESA